MTTSANGTDGSDFSPASENPEESARQLTPLATLERTIGIQLRNRFIWLLLVLALYVLGELSYVQWQTATQQGNPRFDTFELMSHLMAVIEAALLGTALLVALGTPATRAAWYRRRPDRHFSYVASGIGGTLIILLMLALLIAPLLYLHRYPELAEQGIRIPLMLLQRALLVGCAVLVSYNLVLLFRFVLRFPWWLAGICGAAAHVALGYGITYLSFTSETFLRLNDVFYYNQLFPDLQVQEVFVNMQMPFYGYYLAAGAAAVVFATLLWLPRGAALSASDLPVGPSSSVERLQR